MNSQDAIKALNIVFTHWINPSLEIKRNALIKLQRFCRRGSGAHAHHSMICKKAEFGQMFGPPVLYRQRNCCLEGQCKSIPIRIYKKYKRMQYTIKKIYDSDDTGCLHFHCPPDEPARQDEYGFAELSNVPILDKHYTSMNCCYCNNKPIGSYQWMVSHPRGNFTACDGIRYIMCELSGDELTYYTRFKLSQYITNRLR